jgi:RNA polymerase sigma-70 factor (ECF subfamily)
MASSQEVLWLLQAQSGDRAALDRLLQAIQARLYGYLVSLVHDEHLAMDLLQDVFVIVIQKLRWLREPGAFLAWVYRIASREAFRALRKRRRLEECHETDQLSEAVAAEVAEEKFDPEMIERIPDLLDQVSPASRVVLSVHYLHEMSLSEVADILELPPGTTKARLAYGLQVLRRRLNEHSSPPRLGETAHRGQNP